MPESDVLGCATAVASLEGSAVDLQHVADRAQRRCQAHEPRRDVQADPVRRWSSLASVRRYAKGGRPAQVMSSLPMRRRPLCSRALPRVRPWPVLWVSVGRPRVAATQWAWLCVHTRPRSPRIARSPRAVGHRDILPVGSRASLRRIVDRAPVLSAQPRLAGASATHERHMSRAPHLCAPQHAVCARAPQTQSLVESPSSEARRSIRWTQAQCVLQLMGQ